MHFNSQSLAELFPVVFVINLPDRQDRWDAFGSRLGEQWPFGKVVRFPAVNGHAAPPPNWWTAGEGAWGCYRSHVQILEACLTEGIDRVLIMEDDAFLVDDFFDVCHKFFDHLPHDWKMIYLGGQHLEQHTRLPKKVNEWVYQPYNVNRTHCYAIQGRDTIRELYRFLNDAKAWKEGHHIDHHYGEWHKTQPHGVYVPSFWLAGQAEGMSNITCKEEQMQLWMGAEDLVNGKINRNMIAIVGGFRSGASCIAGALSHLGIDLGDQLVAPTDTKKPSSFEDKLLGDVCRNIFKEPWLERKIGSEESTSLLRWWASTRCHELKSTSQTLCGKHPLLSLLIPELETAWKHPRFIVVDRPIEASKASLRKTTWGWPNEAIEYALPRILQLRDHALASTNASFIRVEYDRIRREPRPVIDAIIDFLQCAPNGDQVASAISSIHQDA